MARRIPRYIGIAVLGIVAAVAVSIPFVAPALAAYACPGCYGLEKVAERVYVESDRDSAALLATIKRAEEQVSRAFDLSQPPETTFLVCDTEACDQRLGGKGARATTYGTEFIRVSPRGRDQTILSHELAHVALHDAFGAIRLMQGDLTAWRNEGLSVLVSGDDRYFDFETPACLEQPDTALPETPSAWGKAMRPDTHLELYGRAACAVFRLEGLPPYDLAKLTRKSRGAE